jgi:hypothetical protein
MSLKNEIEKTMFVEGVDDRMQDIASLIDSPVEDVKARMKTLSFSDYIKVMSALKSKDESTIKSMMGLSESIATDIKDYVDDHKKHFDAYPMDVEVGDKVYDYDEYWEILDKVYPDMKQSEVKEGWSELPAMPEKYKARDGLEGPIMTKSGKVVYYDPKEGSYYDPDTDIFLSYDEWKSLDEAYSTGSQGPDARGKDAYVGVEEPVEPTPGAAAQSDQKMKTARTQAMQRLGRDNLGGATAAQTADAMDKAEKGRPLTPIQRQAMAHQAQNLDNLAMSPDTRIQFRNLLNRLRKQEQL